jgi:hypothetical protein
LQQKLTAYILEYSTKQVSTKQELKQHEIRV